MNLLIALLAATVGYLLGSISFARAIKGLVNPQADISRIEHPVPNTDLTFESDSISATAVRIHVGTRYGCLTALLDMLKVAVPTLLFMLWQPQQPYYLIAAAMGLVGHDWPLYHRFQGGRGESAIFGALLVIDPLGVLITNAAGVLIGALAGHLLVLRWGGLVLMIPWLWFRSRDPAQLAYIVFVNAIYWFTMSPELKQYFELESKGAVPSQEELADFLGMGQRLGRALDRYSLPALFARLVRSRERKEDTGGNEQP